MSSEAGLLVGMQPRQLLFSLPAGSGNVELVRDVLLAAQLHLADTRRPKAAARALKTFVNMRNGLGQTAMELACKFGWVWPDHCRFT